MIMEQTEFISLVEETLEVDPGTVNVTDRLEDIDWDSLANIGLIAEIDTKLGVTLDSERLARSVTVADLYELVKDSISA